MWFLLTTLTGWNSVDLIEDPDVPQIHNIALANHKDFVEIDIVMARFLYQQLDDECTVNWRLQLDLEDFKGCEKSFLM